LIWARPEAGSKELQGIIWFDVVTPKHALFTKALIERSPPGMEHIVTTRDYAELNSFVKKIQLHTISIGEFGGGELYDKLRASAEREKLLANFARKNDFQISISSNSPEAARVSFKLGIKHYIYGDSPHGVAPNKLASPLATKLFTPFVIPKNKWTQFGLKSEQVIQYRALDPWCWLIGKWESLVAKRRRKLGRNEKKEKQRVFIRMEEWFATYLKRDRGISKVLERLVETIEKAGDFEILLVPRYESQREWARKEFGDRCVVPDSAIDGAETIAEMDLVIGGGGTMTQEAALLGVPNISYFPSVKLDVFENFYFPRRLSKKAVNPKGLINSVRNMLRNIDDENKSYLERAEKETRDFEDPSSVIFENIEL
jgi:predicted glycosyltransferase